MSNVDFDLLVIGAGSGGVRAARMAAANGVRVAIAERRYYGGTCVNVGCVPKKLFSYGAQFSESFNDAKGFGWQHAGDQQLDWPTLRDNKTREIERLNGIYQNLLKGAGVEMLWGEARVCGPNEVEIEGQRYRAERILLATGGQPFVPNFPGDHLVSTSDQLFYWEQLPTRAVVVGGGYIAAEFASILNGLGVQVTLLYRGELFLRGFDREIREFLAEQMRSKGVELRFNTQVTRIDEVDGQRHVILDDGEVLCADQVLYATGRVPALGNLGLENTRVELLANGKIAVNAQFQTQEPSIYALGDIIDGPELTPVALAQAMAFVKTHYQGQPATVDYENLPTAIFTLPNVATVGLSEEQAQAAGHEVAIFTSAFRPMKNTLSGNPERTLMKLVVDRVTDRVLGAHMVGPDAGEVVQGLAVALKAGATKAIFDSTIGIHPSAAEEFVTMRQATR